MLIALAAPAHGQLVRGYGLKAGLTYSDVRSPDLDGGGERSLSLDTERRPGMAILGFVEWLTTPAFSLVTEAGYLQRGFQQTVEVRTDPGPGGALDEHPLDTRLDYASVAALAKLRRPTGAAVPYISGGPRVDFFLGGTPSGDGSLASSYAPAAVGGTIGVGVEIPQALPVALFVEARYNIDISNALPDVPRDAYNNAFDLLVGVRLD